MGDEREANMLAVIASAKFWKNADIVSERKHSQNN